MIVFKSKSIWTCHPPIHLVIWNQQHRFCTFIPVVQKDNRVAKCISKWFHTNTYPNHPIAWSFSARAIGNPDSLRHIWIDESNDGSKINHRIQQIWCNLPWCQCLYAGLEVANSQSNRLQGLQLTTKANTALVTTTSLTISNSFQTQDFLNRMWFIVAIIATVEAVAFSCHCKRQRTGAPATSCSLLVELSKLSNLETQRCNDCSHGWE